MVYIRTMILASLTAFTMAFSQSDFFGKLILFALLALSAICWIVLVYKIQMARRVRALSSHFEHALKTHEGSLLHFDLSSLPPLQPPHPFQCIFKELKDKTLEILNKNHYFLNHKGSSDPVYLSPIDLDILENHVLTTISSQRKHLERHVFLLSTIATLAPFLGLLGTVWGILVTFAEFHGSSSVSSNATILSGISTALATTVLGLLIAIPALVAYNYLRTVLVNYTSEMEDFLYTLLSQIELQYRKVDIS